MFFDLQKAAIWKRVSAFLFDLIILGIVAAGIAYSLSVAFGYDDYSQTLEQSYARYEKEFGTTFELTEAEYDSLTPEGKQNYERAYSALLEDQPAMHAYSMMVNLTLVITTVSILLGYLILEFAVPLLLKNGQTLGKKIFGIGVIRTDGVKINGMLLFIRTILGKFTIETMIPVYVAMMIFFGTIGLPGTVLVLGLLLVQVALVIFTRTNSPIHDLLAKTVAVDIASQMVFDTEAEMLEYKKKVHAEMAARQDY